MAPCFVLCIVLYFDVGESLSKFTSCFPWIYRGYSLSNISSYHLHIYIAGLSAHSSEICYFFAHIHRVLFGTDVSLSHPCVWHVTYLVFIEIFVLVSCRVRSSSVDSNTYLVKVLIALSIEETLT